MERLPVYMFQCNHCWLVDGVMSRNPQDALTCCGGETMDAIVVAPKEAEDDPTASHEARHEPRPDSR